MEQYKKEAKDNLLLYDDPDEEGIWHIEGEDQSYGGMWDRSIIPNLGFVEGKYKNAVDYAINQPSFFGLACRGGTISKIKTRKV